MEFDQAFAFPNPDSCRACARDGRRLTDQLTLVRVGHAGSVSSLPRVPFSRTFGSRLLSRHAYRSRIEAQVAAAGAGRWPLPQVRRFRSATTTRPRPRAFRFVRLLT